MKQLLIGFVVALVLGGSINCAKAPPNLSPDGVSAFNNLRIQRGMDLVRDTAIVANDQIPPVISTATTRMIVMWHRSAIILVHERSTDWQNLLSIGLDELQKNLPQEERQLIAPYITLVKTILAEVNR